MEITHETLTDIASILDAEIDLDYSGRGMYGKTCPGIVHDHSSFYVGVIVARALIESPHDFESDWIEEIAFDARTDNMGRSTITYFPNLTVRSES